MRRWAVGQCVGRYIRLITLVVLTSCSDLTEVVPPTPSLAPLIPGLTFAVACRATIADRTVLCGPVDNLANFPSGSLVGRGDYVQVNTTTSSYSPTTEVFSTDVTIQNLIGQTLGTRDGHTVSGVHVILESEPHTTAGAGSVWIMNADGNGSTEFGRPLFLYHEALAPKQISGAKNWQWHVPTSVAQFSFEVLVQGEVTFPQGWVSLTPIQQPLEIGSSLALSAKVLNAVGVETSGSVAWASSEPSVASIQPLGPLSAVMNGLANGQAMISAIVVGSQSTGAIPITVGLSPPRSRLDGANYRLDGTTGDESRDAFDAVPFGHGTFTVDRFGRPGRALLFDGSVDSLRIPAGATNNSPSGTITFWLALNGLDASHLIFAMPLRTPCRAPSNPQPYLPCDYALAAQFGLPTLGNEVDRFYFQSNGDQPTYVTPAQPDFTAWHMYTFTWSGGRKRVYFDGVLIGETLVAESSTLPGGELTFGAQSGERTMLSGALDDITIYRRELTDEEVASLYAASSPAPLRELADRRGLLIGSAFSITRETRFDTTYKARFAREFSVLTPENTMKFGPIQPQPGVFNFSQADSQVAFAQANGITVRGHTLVWHRQWPSWATVEASNWDREKALSRLKQHITTVVGHFQGRVAFWDVVNEALCDDGSLKPGCPRGGTVVFDPWLEKIGPAYIDSAFTWAHQADPDALLFYNEFGIEGSTPKADSTLALIQRLRRNGVPIHGVGFQAHFGETIPVPATLATNMKRFTDLGIQVQITELEYRVRLPSTPQSLAAQAEAYRTVAEACLGNPSCTALVMWGFTDARSWIPSRLPGWGDALILNTSFQAKPASGALYDALR